MLGTSGTSSDYVQFSCSGGQPPCLAILVTKALLARELVLARSCTLRGAQHMPLPPPSQPCYAATARLQPSRIFTAPGIVVGQQQAMIDSSLISSAICICNSMHKRIKDYTTPPVLLFQNFHQYRIVGSIEQQSASSFTQGIKSSKRRTSSSASEMSLCPGGSVFSRMCHASRADSRARDNTRALCPNSSLLLVCSRLRLIL